MPRPKLVILGLVVAGVAGLALFAINRERAPAASLPVAATPAVEKAAEPPRPALTAAEEQYIRALWPIHGDVQRSTVRMSLGQIFYLTQDLGRDELRKRVEEALATYRTADTRLRALEPPATLRSDHEEYLSAVRLFQESAVEVQKMFTDGRDDDHMQVAYPKSQKGSDKIREVGGKLWPHEYPPH